MTGFAVAGANMVARVRTTSFRRWLGALSVVAVGAAVTASPGWAAEQPGDGRTAQWGDLGHGR